MNNVVIGLSGAARAGKDTAAIMIKHILESNFEKKTCLLAYADYLKMICMKNFGYVDKKTDRKVLQDFGENIRKENEDFWMSTTWYTIDQFRNLFDMFIISDVRYENELHPYPWNIVYPFIKVLVKRDTSGLLNDDEAAHESEAMAHDGNESKYDFIIDNNGTLEETYVQVLKMVNEIMDRWDEWFSELKAKNPEGSVSDALQREQA